MAKKLGSLVFGPPYTCKCLVIDWAIDFKPSRVAHLHLRKQILPYLQNDNYIYRAHARWIIDKHAIHRVQVHRVDGICIKCSD